jgi:predicted metal-dependent peptidase
MLYGTSRLLGLKGPHSLTDDSSRNFYLTARIYEVIRSLTFHEATFLNHETWHQLRSHLRIAEKTTRPWKPFEEMVDLMISISGLLQRYDTL